MPDCHTGFGMPIGGVLAAKDAVVPNAVGVDIGCGMCAVKTDLKKLDREVLKKIMSDIRRSVPVGFAHHKIPPANKLKLPGEPYPVFRKEKSNIECQLGTLGGGNHFIEVQKGSDSHIWFMLHTGSRNFGKQVCDYYNSLAKSENMKGGGGKDLSSFRSGTELFSLYMAEMNFALSFARENRRLISERIKEAFLKYTDCSFLDEVNIHHNYAAAERHFYEDVIIHRKGATSARKGETGIIPGSQGTSSFIVEGLGNEESFYSCSHGAGRVMSRHAARKELDLGIEKKKLDEKGILHAIRSAKDLDEASSAYKDIDEVMRNQKDLVKVLVKLEPLGVIKG